MEILFSLSIALFAGLMLSRLAILCKLPAVTAYLIAGILVGPFCLGAFGIEGLGFHSFEYLETFSIISDVALGFIAFSIGNEFRLSQGNVRRGRPQIRYLCERQRTASRKH